MDVTYTIEIEDKIISTVVHNNNVYAKNNMATRQPGCINRNLIHIISTILSIYTNYKLQVADLRVVTMLTHA